MREAGRAKILTELYLRAYWREYLAATAWVTGVTMLWPFH